MTTQNLNPEPVSRAAAPTCWPASDDGTIEGGEGARLWVRRTRSAEPVRGVVVVTHGLGEHAGRYGHVAAELVLRGMGVCGWDLRGHGRSSGARGDAARYDLLGADLGRVVAHFREESLPLFHFAHSLGGQVVLRYLEEGRPRCAGAVIASPWLRLAFNPPWWKLWLARMALGIRPSFAQETGTRLERLSRDLDHLSSLPDLDLVHHRLSARLYFALRAAGELAIADAGRLTTPLLLLHGDDDPITSHHATLDLFERAGSADKTLRILSGVRHETHNDLERVATIQEIGAWMEARLHPSK